MDLNLGEDTLNMNSPIGEEGLKLVKLFQETLNITNEEAMKILTKNKTAEALLKEELALAFTGENKNLSALLSITLLRNPYDFEPLRDYERKLIDEHYV